MQRSISARLLLTAVLYISTSTTSLVADDKPAAAESTRLKVLIVGAHPDDPESGAGGLIRELANGGHDVHVAYAVTYRQGRQYFGRDEKDVRRAEATAACKILGAEPHFFDYGASQLFADAETSQKITEWINELKPDVVLTHCPLDTHPDHAAISSLVWRAYQHQGGWNLYFFEVNSGHQTLGYTPNLYLDIAKTRDAKHQALLSHASQDPEEGIWKRHHDPMHARRGAECGIPFAEAYSLVESKPGCRLLPVEFLKPTTEPAIQK